MDDSDDEDLKPPSNDLPAAFTPTRLHNTAQSTAILDLPSTHGNHATREAIGKAILSSRSPKGRLRRRRL